MDQDHMLTYCWSILDLIPEWYLEKTHADIRIRTNQNQNGLLWSNSQLNTMSAQHYAAICRNVVSIYSSFEMTKIIIRV